MNTMQVRALMHELMDENPFAIRAVLKILAVEFTDAVPTLAVTNEPQPRLLINLAFIDQHCRTEEHVKALLCHEFLHVLLRHTDEPGRAEQGASPGARCGDQRDHPPAAGREVFQPDVELLRPGASGLAQLLRPMTRDEWGRYRRRHVVQAIPAGPVVVEGLGRAVRRQAAGGRPRAARTRLSRNPAAARPVQQARAAALRSPGSRACSVITRTTRRCPRRCNTHSIARARK